jgi:hypothetical protein
MSMTRLAVRLAAVQALLGATLAEGRVYDSDTTPIDAALDKQPLPFLMVTTETHQRDITGLDLTHGNDSLELVVVVAIAASVSVEAPDGSSTVQIVIPATDAGLELTLDLVEAQIARALTSRLTEWSRVFCGMVPRITGRMSQRGASAEEGIKFAARQIIFTCDCLADPVPGEALPDAGSWAAFMAAMEASELAPLAPLIRAQIEGAETLDWVRISQMLGISDEAMDGIGLAPAVLSVGGDPVQMDEVVVVPEEGADMALTEEAADEQGV